MKKNLFLLFIAATTLFGCAHNASHKEYPEIAPTFSYRFCKSAYTRDYIDVDSFVLGSDYLLELYVSNFRTEHSFAYQEDITFSFNENDFEIFPLFAWTEGTKTDCFQYVVHAKAITTNTTITFKYLDAEILKVEKPVRECSTKLSYYRYDTVANVSPIEDDHDYHQKITLVKSAAELSNYLNLTSGFLTPDDAFFAENNLLYITLPWHPSNYSYKNYFIDSNTVYFRIIGPKYYMNSDSFIEDFTFTTFVFAIGKTDCETYQNFDIWYNYTR